MYEELAMPKFFCKLVEGCNADDPLDRSPHCKALDDSTLVMFTSTVSCVFFRVRSITFLARWTPPGGCSKKATWADLVANGPPISISTWWMLSVRHPRWILGRLAVLAAEKEVPPGQVKAFTLTATAFPNLV
jgi:hypothetical protein